MDNRNQRVRCTQCGQIDRPGESSAGKVGIAIGLWILSTVLWAIGFFLVIPSVLFIGIALLLPALIYTLWYFYKREVACRHCGSPHLEPSSEPT